MGEDGRGEGDRPVTWHTFAGPPQRWHEQRLVTIETRRHGDWAVDALAPHRGAPKDHHAADIR